ncbi:MAG: type IV pilus modification protein PilV [Herminiimonas sp.]|nr:type IV pilus modification protein PilV [Herminiimonas sp.]
MPLTSVPLSPCVRACQQPHVRTAAGFALIEVMVTFLILGVGMLGIAGMLLTAQKSNTSSYAKQQAVQSAYDIVERIRANRLSAINGSYNVNNLTTTGAASVPAAPSPDCGAASCTATQIVTYDLWYWLANDLAQLPNGSGAITTAVSGANTLLTITVQWDDAPAQSKLGGASQSASAQPNLARFSVQTLL